MIPPSSAIYQQLAEYERQLRAERFDALASEATCSAAEQEIEVLLGERHFQLLAAADSCNTFPAAW